MTPRLRPRSLSRVSLNLELHASRTVTTIVTMAPYELARRARAAAVALIAALAAAQQGPVALYPLTADAADVSGGGRHGTVGGGVVFSSSGALFSPGASISIPPIYAPTLTLVASFKLRSDMPRANEYNVLFCRAGGHYHQAIIWQPGVLGFYNGDAGGFVASSLSLQVDTWYNLTAVYNRDGPGSVVMHVNGQWVYRGGGGFDTATRPLDIIGNIYPGSDADARGWLRNVAIYPYALSDADIVSQWPMQTHTPTPTLTSNTPTRTPTASPTVAPSSGPIALYPLTADAADVSGGSRHGTISGGVTFSSSGALFSPGSSIRIPPVLAPALSIRASFLLRSDFPRGLERYITLFCRDGGQFHHVLIEPSAGVLGFWHLDGFFSSSFTPQLDVWHNLTAVYNRDGPGSVAMHVNGQWVYRGGGGFDTAAIPLDIIGNKGISENLQYARGWMRNVAIYPYALSDAEITAWNSPSATPTPSSTPSPTPTPFCPPSRFQRMAALGLAGELLRRTPAIATEQDCASACCLDAACEGYSYAPDSPRLVCALYANVTGAVPNILVDSGVLRVSLAALTATGGAL